MKFNRSGERLVFVNILFEKRWIFTSFSKKEKHSFFLTFKGYNSGATAPSILRSIAETLDMLVSL